MSKTIKTPKGTELPLSNIKGKDYLEVKYRLLWFLEEKQDWSIETEVIASSKEYSTVRAVVKDPSGKVVRTAYKTEDLKGFYDHLEKAETGAIGRALGFMGYGTAHALELEEGDRVVDSPVAPKQESKKSESKAVQPEIIDPGEAAIDIGKAPNRKFKDVDHKELQRILDWIEHNKVKTPKAKRFQSIYEQFIQQELDQEMRVPG